VLPGPGPLLPAAISRGERNVFNCALKGSIVLSGVAMATTNDLRRYPRLSSPNSTILAWQTASLRHVSHVINLGLGGMYIRTTDPPPPGTFIQLLLDVPAGEVRARAVVQRSKSKEGMGVKFVAMQQEDRARFAQWLKRLSS
jgi:PilZ domain-containing protein